MEGKIIKWRTLLSGVSSFFWVTAVMLTRHWRQDGRSYDNTSSPSEPRQTHNHRETEGRKKNYYYQISQMRGNKRDQKIGISWVRSLTVRLPNTHTWPLWKMERLLSLLMQLRIFYCSLKVDIMDFVYWHCNSKAHRSVNFVVTI